jgi:type IV pilus assembly protein PilO
MDFSFKSLDPLFEKIEKITKIQRILIYVGAFILLIGPVVYFSFFPKFNKIDALEKELDSLNTRLLSAKRQASQLKSWRKKFNDAKIKFAQAKKALPLKKEIPSLLTNISKSGREAGLEFLLFRPKAEKKKKFYAQIPVSIKVNGTFHEVATFFDNVSKLPRLVNIDDIKLGSIKKGNKLNITCTAITYRFIEAKPKKRRSKKK